MKYPRLLFNVEEQATQPTEMGDSLVELNARMD